MEFVPLPPIDNDPMSELESKLGHAQAKLQETAEQLKLLQENQVRGGDNELIWLRKTIYWRDVEFGIEIFSGEVYSLSVREEDDKVFKEDFIVSAGDSWELNPSECFSTYEAVPGGEYV